MTRNTSLARLNLAAEITQVGLFLLTLAFSLAPLRPVYADAVTVPSTNGLLAGVEINDRAIVTAVLRAKTRVASLSGADLFPIEFEFTYDPDSQKVRRIQARSAALEAPGRLLKDIPSTITQIIPVQVTRDLDLGLEVAFDLYLIGFKYESASMRCEDRYHRTKENDFVASRCKDHLMGNRIGTHHFSPEDLVPEKLAPNKLATDPLKQPGFRFFTELAAQILGGGIMTLVREHNDPLIDIGHLDFARIRAAFGFDVTVGPRDRDALRVTLFDTELLSGVALGGPPDERNFRAGPFLLGSLHSGAALDMGKFQVGLHGGLRFLTWDDLTAGADGNASLFVMFSIGFHFDGGGRIPFFVF